jgi:hypothetical protein
MLAILAILSPAIVRLDYLPARGEGKQHEEMVAYWQGCGEGN